jgi:hypothetical protein
MNEIDHFNFFVLCSGDIVADMDHLHVKKIHLVYLMGFSYIVIEDTWLHKVAGQCDHEQGCEAEHKASDELQPETEPFVGAIVVEVHPQAGVDPVEVLLREALLFPEAPDGHDTLNRLREVVDHWSLGDRLKAGQLPRRRQIVALR